MSAGLDQITGVERDDFCGGDADPRKDCNRPSQESLWRCGNANVIPQTTTTLLRSLPIGPTPFSDRVRNAMRIVVTTMVLVLMAAAAQAAEMTAPAAQAKCVTAEINPVTGHVFCINPLGAPVEAPPEEAKQSCKQDSRGQWTWAPNCTPTPEGM